MKYSIVVPTQDRPGLLEVVVKHITQLHYSNIELIVSDNSTSATMRERNAAVLQGYCDHGNVRLIHPPHVLPLPRHFEFALAATSGDYVTYLTDKMVMLPGLMERVEQLIAASPLDVINWTYAPYTIDDFGNPSGPGTLVEDVRFLRGSAVAFDPREALRFKASGEIPRDQQRTDEYAQGKIVFGFYSRTLIQKILAKTGAVFGGVTHDYSAMIQALSLAQGAAMLNSYGIIFISLPPDRSLGSLTASHAQSARRYFEAFDDGERMVEDLLVPGVYASQHNMVAYDYKKYLPAYGNDRLFDAGNWLASVAADLTSKGRVWSSSDEREAQLKLLKDYLSRTHQHVRSTRGGRSSVGTRVRNRVSSAVSSVAARLSGKPTPSQFQQVRFRTLDEAVQHLSASVLG